jgi:ribosome-associated protein
MGVPVILNDLFIAGFGVVHDLSFITVCAAAYDTDDDGAMHEIEISTDTIRLGQFLKLSNLVDSGSDAKFLLAEGEVMVNDEVEIRRGRQLRAGDVVEYDGIAVRVVAED